jgi:signal transduction histidine kinase/ActR/RegA family two-component response regulator
VTTDDRVLVLMPTVRDGERTRNALAGTGLECAVCQSMGELCRELERGGGVALLTEEAVAGDPDRCLQRTLRSQPQWSDFPLVLLAREGSEGTGLRESMNVMLVERPVRLRSLLSVVRAALRSRRHQYAIRDHLAERARQAEALREADRQKDDFIAMMAHELRNPLAPIRNGLQILRLSAGNTEAVVKVQAMMDRQLTHMVRLVDDLLDVSRISRNKMELRRERVPLSEVVTSAVETARPLIDALGHDLTVSLPRHPVSVDADHTRLAQVFANLLTNSAKYTEPGGRIRLAAEVDSSEVVVIVRDDGIGIPAEAMPRIFDMFSQVDRSIERAAGGLGIGLALVRGLVEMHGGTVAAESAGQGKGSAFTVRLPISEGSATTQGGDERTNGSHGIGRRVLVVDDNQDSATSMALMLQLLGDHVVTAHDGVAGVEAAEKFRPDVILMDVGMPRLNGLDATRHIREQPWGKGMTVIALTGWGQDADKERSRAAGCDGHLIKPVNLPDLEKLLAETQDSGGQTNR